MKSVFFGLLLTFATLSCFAGGGARPQAPSRPYATNIGSPGVLEVTPDSLERALFTGNQNILHSFNAVLRQRDQVAIARANLIPSISLNMILAISNPPAFLMNSVSCLIPFLFPSAWHNLNAADRTFNAEIMALHTTRLNTYSVAATLANHMQGDALILEMLETQTSRVRDYVQGLELQVRAGFISQTELDRATSDLDRMQIDVSVLRELISTERSTLRQMMGADLNQEIRIQMGDVSPSEFESRSALQNIDTAIRRAPERAQLDLLIEAARANVAASQWGFLGGCAGSQGFLGTSNSNTFTVSTAIGINFGFGYFPQVSLSGRNLHDVEIRQRELVLELQRLLESTQSSIQEVRGRLEIALHSEQVAQDRVRDQLVIGSVREVLEAYAALTAAKVAVITARTVLSGHRITLKRISLEGRFLRVLNRSRQEIEFTNW